MVRSRVVEGREGDARPPPPNPAMPYREDCWSEGATSTLIDAWGERYMELSRGNLRQKHWQEVADAVNSRRTVAKRPMRTDVQCKNRIDTIKKKFKAEKARVAETGGSVESQWPFYSRLESLIGPSQNTTAVASKKPSNSPSPLPALSLPPPRKRMKLVTDSSLRWGNYSAAAAAAAAAAAREDDEDSESSRSMSAGRSGKKKVREMNGGFSGGGGVGPGGSGEEVDAVEELAQAIVKFGEIYERVEVSKQKHMIEMEKQRWKFNKEVEFQRMQMFIDTQVQLQKIKRRKASSSGDGEESGFSGADLLNLHSIKMLT